MIYVERDSQANIRGVYANRQEGYAEEELPDDHPDVVEFLHPVLSHNAAIDEAIAKAESAVPITPRALREFMLMVLQFAKVDPASNSAFAKVAALDAQVQALRGQRT